MTAHERIREIHENPSPKGASVVLGALPEIADALEAAENVRDAGDLLACDDAHLTHTLPLLDAALARLNEKLAK